MIYIARYVQQVGEAGLVGGPNYAIVDATDEA
jgi:hypothetical protein